MLHHFLPRRPSRLNGIRSQGLTVIFLTAIPFLVLGGFLIHLGDQITSREIESELEGRLATTSALISQTLSGPMTVVKLMAHEEGAIRALDQPQSTQAVAAANRLMDDFKEISGVSVTAICTAEGRLLATNKRGLGFLGCDLSFRPYVRNALAGNDFQYLALGHNEKRRGCYAATPVRGPEGRILGVAMVKVEIDENLVGINKTEHVHLVSPDGVIFLSSDPARLYKDIRPVPAQRRRELQQSKQFGNERLEPLEIDWKSEIGEVSWGDHTFLYKEAPVGPPGWRLLIFRDKSPIFRLRCIMAAIALSIFLISSLGILAFVRTRETARLLSASNSELEKRVDARTAELTKSNQDLRAQIAEREKVEQALQDSNEVFSAIDAAARDAIIMIDDYGRVTYWSRACEPTFGYSREEMLGKDLHRVLAPDRFHDTFRKALNCFRETGQGEAFGKTIELIARRKDGAEFPIELSLSSVRVRERWHAVGIIRDITERKRAEEELRKSEQKHRLLAENSSDVIWTMDLDLNYTYISRAIERIQGWNGEDCESLTIEDILPPQSLQVAFKRMEAHLAHGEKTGDYSMSDRFEMELYCKDGSTIWTEITASFILGENGKPVGIQGVTRDITERLRSQKEKEELQEKLARSRKMEALGLLAGGVAHDLNNVLSGIVSYPDLLLMDLPEGDPLRGPIETIRESGQKATVIVQDLLTLARRGVTTHSVVNLNRIVDEYLLSPEHQKMLAYHPNILIHTRFEDRLPNIKGSPFHLKKMVMNLVSNAAEAQLGGGEIFIRTESRYLDRPLRGYEQIVANEYVVLRIEDRGEGIPEDQLHRIFEPFYTKKVMGRSGTGLGMSVVWGTVQDHSGYIDVRSSEGEGTIFELYFPMTREEIEAAQAPHSIESYAGSQEAILVVDDVEGQRELAKKILTKLNYQVDTVSSGNAAIEYLKRKSVDLVVLDMIMDPGLDGLDTHRRILEIRPGQKAIIASGFAETDRVKKSQQLGAGVYIKKPYTLEKIGQAIRDELDTGK
ncbi:MAG: PAS domain S-box protein [Desulfobacterales bacterium]|nr:MAG: PAS domain S-box protein [Desulfobacterales bacterium]